MDLLEARSHVIDHIVGGWMLVEKNIKHYKFL